MPKEKNVLKDILNETSDAPLKKILEEKTGEKEENKESKKSKTSKVSGVFMTPKDIEEEFVITSEFNYFNMFNFMFTQSVSSNENPRFVMFKDYDDPNIKLKSFRSNDLKEFLGADSNDIPEDVDIEMSIIESIDFVPDTKIMIFVDCRNFKKDTTPSGMKIYGIDELIEEFGDEILFNQLVVVLADRSNSGIGNNLYSLVNKRIGEFPEDRKWISFVRSDIRSNETNSKILQVFLKRNGDYVSDPEFENIPDEIFDNSFHGEYGRTSPEEWKKFLLAKIPA